MITAVLEYMGSENYSKVTPVIFELNMKFRYSETSDVSRMFDKCRENVVYDMGQILTYNIGTIVHQVPSSAIYSNSAWNKEAKIRASSWNTKLKKICSALSE